ncbi:hypothetical protein ACJX0J_012102 [Zea mays]
MAVGKHFASLAGAIGFGGTGILGFSMALAKRGPLKEIIELLIFILDYRLLEHNCCICQQFMLEFFTCLNISINNKPYLMRKNGLGALHRLGNVYVTLREKHFSCQDGTADQMQEAFNFLHYEKKWFSLKQDAKKIRVIAHVFGFVLFSLNLIKRLIL